MFALNKNKIIISLLSWNNIIVKNYDKVQFFSLYAMWNENNFLFES